MRLLCPYFFLVVIGFACLTGCQDKAPLPDYLEVQIIDDLTGASIDDISFYYEYIVDGGGPWGHSTSDTLHILIPPGEFIGRTPLPAFGDCISDVRMVRNERYHPLNYYTWYCKSKPFLVTIKARPTIPFILHITSSNPLPDLSIIQSLPEICSVSDPQVYCEQFINRYDIPFEGTATLDTMLLLRTLPRDSIALTLFRTNKIGYEKKFFFSTGNIDTLHMDVKYF